MNASTTTRNPDIAQEVSGRSVQESGRSPRSSVPFIAIAAIVLGFIVYWPVGLALLFLTIWRDRIFAYPPIRKAIDGDLPRPAKFSSSVRSAFGKRPDNSALAEYLEREQNRLKAEQQKLDELVQAFEAFKQAEREASDRRDFDEFLRAREAVDNDASTREGPAGR